MVQRAPAKKLAGALLSRGYQIGRPQLRVGGDLSHHPACIAARPVRLLTLCPT